MFFIAFDAIMSLGINIICSQTHYMGSFIFNKQALSSGRKSTCIYSLLYVVLLACFYCYSTTQYICMCVCVSECMYFNNAFAYFTKCYIHYYNHTHSQRDNANRATEFSTNDKIFII